MIFRIAGDQGSFVNGLIMVVPKMRNAKPCYNWDYQFVQPDYDKWESVREGMSRADVIRYLGDPIAIHNGTVAPSDESSALLYGYLRLPMVPHEFTYVFRLFFDVENRVIAKVDPFDRPLSLSGKPSTPRIIIPANKSEFRHYPRILDVRWSPSSGDYPIEYCVSVGYKRLDEDAYTDHAVIKNLLAPHYICSFGGAQEGRIRVKGKNSLGESEWSECREFTFCV